MRRDESILETAQGVREKEKREEERESERERRNGIDLCALVIACFILISVHTVVVHSGYIV